MLLNFGIEFEAKLLKFTLSLCLFSSQIYCLLGEDYGNVTIYGPPFHNNSCEFTERETTTNETFNSASSALKCMSCTIIISETQMESTFVTEEFDNLEPLGTALDQRDHQLIISYRYFCTDKQDNTKCELKPRFTIKTHEKLTDFDFAQLPTGFEIAIRKQSGGLPKYVEVKIDRKMYKQLEFPTIDVDFVPGYKFEPDSEYQFVLYSLPKIGPDDLEEHEGMLTHLTPPLPTQQELDALNQLNPWPQNEHPKCTEKVWCFRGPNCTMASELDNLGTVKSFLIAFSVCMLFISFFVIVIGYLRFKSKKLSNGDSEFLFGDDEEDGSPVIQRSNETELAVIEKPNAEVAGSSHNGVASSHKNIMNRNNSDTSVNNSKEHNVIPPHLSANHIGGNHNSMMMSALQTSELGDNF